MYLEQDKFYIAIQNVIESTNNDIITNLNDLLGEASICLDKLCEKNNLDLKSSVSKELYNWIEIQKLTELMALKNTRKIALSKLTPEERKALGFK